MSAAPQNLFLYARKSTDVEDKQVLSIEAQINDLREFAARQGIRIVGELIEKQSAKLPGRPVFNEMLTRLERGEADGILAWHPDRLARNSMDGGRIIYLLDTGDIKTLSFPTFRFESDPQGKFMLNIMFGQSKYYVDSLSENTKRGLREKVRRGEYPCVAPLGYLNDYRTKKIIVDRERGPVVAEAFRRYAEGTETFDTIRQFFGDHGIRTKNGKLLVRYHMMLIFNNPFYYGHFRYAGEIHEGTHEPLISKQLFDEVQAVLTKRFRWRPHESQRKTKPLTALLHCAECGGAITAEVQKGHTYYRCTKKGKLRDWCKQPYVREEALDMEISTLLRKYQLRPDWAEEMLSRIAQEKLLATQSAAQLAAVTRAELEKLNFRIQKLLDSLLDGVIEREDYAAQKSKMMSQKKSLQEKIARLTAGRADWLEPFQNWVLTAKNAGEIANSGSLQEKRVLALKIFGSNLVLDCKKARGSSVKPWSLLAEKSLTGGMVPRLGLEPRTN